ncbi:alpha-glucuronidase [Sphingobacterium sp. SGG-5]|uniref:alpha-glucuronidase family glycosyl hydrolase n=1 Tax=Sphingobacterium sp. SGG-5 TaxID=2710881 RepID=UPI0013EAB43A|nr:alpha-glucuronidase family glycosyl hydrolase [Sphingobacterium sp. SGG-5]NGM61531.1 alpha-glucuronidase [Sphingobacterium sp. SGG-5]
MQKPIYFILYIFILLTISFKHGICKADDGYNLWLRYEQIQDEQYRNTCKGALNTICVLGHSPAIEVARRELERGLSGLLGTPIKTLSSLLETPAGVIVTTLKDLPNEVASQLPELMQLQKESFLIKQVKRGKVTTLYIVGKDDAGVLYGVFHLLRTIQTGGDLDDIDQLHFPKLQWRMLNHWDNLNGTVERGYAGLSIWKWDELPEKIDVRYIDYARANASIGINGVVLNNVNASPQILTPEYIEKVKALADVFRVYNIRVFLAVNFASPKVLSALQTADPLNPDVKMWWKDRIAAIYQRIPDFGGFLVKANSEGQPGPQDYGRTHADGANMLATLLKPYNGILIWRAFVYKAHNPDRVKDAYDEFKPFDGKFLPNVMLQTKNGPLDFQPKEPFSPLFGAMPHTSQIMEFQITQEYLGFSTHLVYLASLYKEVLESDTYANGEGSTVARVIDGSLQGQRLTGMAGVANIGTARNWTGHPFGQANWYAYGRLAWNHQLSAEQLAEEWIRMTLTTDTFAIVRIKAMMLNSYGYIVNYQTPLGLTVLSSVGHHYGPQPWARKSFHKADANGLGFDRSLRGSAAVAQYFPPIRDSFDNIATCPEKYIAWFHHVPWDHVMKSGRTFWEELCFSYYNGVEGVRRMQKNWEQVRHAVAPAVYSRVEKLLEIQEDEAVWWRDACLSYFNEFSKKTIPEMYEKPRYNQKDFKRKESESKSLRHYGTGYP